jgi:DNA-binding NarL/FixJ family response regulator
MPDPLEAQLALKLESKLEFNILVRELTPFEHLVCEHLCEGMTNSAIAKATSHTEKVVENTVSRAAHAFAIKSTGDINVRVLLALAYRSHFGDKAFDKLGITCKHLTIGPNGERICSQHID